MDRDQANIEANALKVVNPSPQAAMRALFQSKSTSLPRFSANSRITEDLSLPVSDSVCLVIFPSFNQRFMPLSWNSDPEEHIKN
ncbi:hypothetical protein CEXT_700001 [Caerostris extrusa]|uniref:Uncharacterized protein n=1 Tax=Caerostris extrusa TaxID=172846 RepID=A0AAV4TSP7_CAEEX|nr:hypothetical protein CEXT_700001 [Caerostris extrusa]